jgi:hypothetical protein
MYFEIDQKHLFNFQITYNRLDIDKVDYKQDNENFYHLNDL